MTDEKNLPKTTSAEPPAGFQVLGGDLEAFWESASPKGRNSDEKPGSPPVLFTPLFVSLMDSQIEPSKPATLIHCRLEAPCELRVAESDPREPEYRVFPAGTLFGIWAKPGMKPLKKLGDVRVWMKSAGFKDVDKPSPMVLFDIRAEKSEGKGLRVMEDRRDRSAPQAVKEARQRGGSEEDFIPF